jgi:hypothetical protein
MRDMILEPTLGNKHQTYKLKIDYLASAIFVAPSLPLFDQLHH